MATKLPTHNIHKRHPTGIEAGGGVPTGGTLDTIDTLVDGANNTANTAVGVTQSLSLIFPLLAGVAGGARWFANKLGITSIARAGDTAQKGLKRFPEKSFSEVFGGSKIADKAADSLGNGLNRVVDSTGASGPINIINEGRAWLRLRNIDKFSSKVNASANLSSDLREHIQKIGNLAKIGNTDHHEVTEALSKFSEIIEAESKNLSKKDAKALGKLGKAVDNHFSSFKNIGDVVKAVPKAIGNAPVLQGVANATLIGASAVGVLAEANGFRKNLASLKQMSADITGKPVSTFSLLFGKVPAPVAEARSNLLKNFAVSEVSGIAALGATVLNVAKKNGVGLVGFMAPQLIGSGVNMLIGESTLPLYTKLSQAHASGNPISAADYAELVSKASPELQARGAAGSVFSKKLGEQYAAEKATPAQVMNEASDKNKIMARVERAIAENKAAKAAVVTKSHVAALEKKGQPDEKHPVVGGHTKRIVADAGQATRALGGA